MATHSLHLSFLPSGPLEPRVRSRALNTYPVWKSYDDGKSNLFMLRGSKQLNWFAEPLQAVSVVD